MRFMLPVITPSYDSSFGDDVPSFGKPQPKTPFVKKGSITRSAEQTKPSSKTEEKKSEPKLTLRILPTWLISKFASYPWVGDKDINQDHYRAPVIP